MPTYEYLCDACGNGFEKFQPITSAPIRKCPKCGKSRVKRLLGTGGGIIFKGSGFYITDYRDKSYTDKAKSESGTTTSDSKSEKKSESKTESKAESKPAKTESKTEAKPPKKSKS